MSDLVRAVHDALNAAALPRHPDPGSLPPRVDGPGVLLPPPDRPHADLAVVLRKRRSSYSFGTAQPTLGQLASLLLEGIGTAPRAGGLASVVPHLVVRAPGDLSAGIHRVESRLPLPHVAPVRTGDPTAYVAGSIDQPPFATRVPVWVALALAPGGAAGRYPARHYRTLHLDAGVAMQNLLLVATALGLAACPVMGYDDAAWSLLLDLPPDGLLAGLVALG